jgi:hypothetical protein
VSRRVRKLSSHPAHFNLPFIEPFDPSSLHAFSAHRRRSARLCGAWSMQARLWSSFHGDVQHPMEAIFDSPMGARHLGEASG